MVDNTDEQTKECQRMPLLFSPSELYCSVELKTYVIGTHQNDLTKMLFMSTHTLSLYGKLTKIILKLIPITHLN